jgi:hypothetical protein
VFYPVRLEVEAAERAQQSCRSLEGEVDDALCFADFACAVADTHWDGTLLGFQPAGISHRGNGLTFITRRPAKTRCAENACRASGTVDRDEFTEISSLIEKCPALRAARVAAHAQDLRAKATCA